VNFCVFTVAVCQRFSSIVLPVSVSFEVEGQRTSRLLILRPVFAFVRRGGSKKNLVAISESINNAKHYTEQDRRNRAFQFHGFFRIHDVDPTEAPAPFS
jgi:hypothetical protein